MFKFNKIFNSLSNNKRKQQSTHNTDKNKNKILDRVDCSAASTSVVVFSNCASTCSQQSAS